jgi:DNA-binding NtrC family response regulator
MTPLSILVVEDEPLMRWSVAETLAASGHHVVETADAEGARRAMRTGADPFDVVLLDLRLPDADDDFSLLANIRAATPRVPVIVMTAFGTPDVACEVRELGAYQVIDKPFDMAALPPLVAAAACSRLGSFRSTGK